ncbi:hypothetical protein [Parageobacillus thermoglucosidasius]|nr:hypothetical protein [Parageobacillus thermoglucosidasius]KYD17824.1 hypothetical protein B4168_2385 [Anoxybacillus flavithermus]OAO87810.1 hypothetical protein GT23_0957 [Parageobacillus thermoglucosidasius]
MDELGTHLHCCVTRSVPQTSALEAEAVFAVGFSRIRSPTIA